LREIIQARVSTTPFRGLAAFSRQKEGKQWPEKQSPYLTLEDWPKKVTPDEKISFL
jgi:hypothetical protein